MVYGAAKKSSGGEDEFLLEQPAGCGNPLGNPIISGNGGDATASDAQAAAAPEQLPPQKTVPVKIEETLPQNPPVSAETPQEPIGKFRIPFMNPVTVFMMFSLIRQAIFGR